ncbi:DUF3826 domain-containing protein [Parapedobacter tibetensis]|uniref:DUF3826 domain-containing protein n=1 Tax=Parapedobacter tibetensis TaxID=2972951 RepID=UPI00214D80F8|nr:DUF3826 domain-containing protein [Parapedobacter tibetensis]
MKNAGYLLLFFITEIWLVGGLYAQDALPVVKVDFNMSGRPRQEVEFEFPNPTYVQWVVGRPTADTVMYNGITFIVRKGSEGEQLAPTYYKASVQAGHDEAKFTNDGISVNHEDVVGRVSIDLIIKGLPAGQHSLRTFHNMTDNLIPENVCPMDIYVNNQLAVDGLVPTVRLEKITEIANTELQLDVAGGEDVVISFSAELSGEQPVKKVIINGFHLNAVDVSNLARAVDPVTGDEYLDVPLGGDYTLTWQGAPIANSHDIYFGTDSMGITTADRNSPFFVGNQSRSDTTYTATDLHSMDSYYWRIDEVVSDNEVHKGSTWKFRTAQLAFPDAEGFGRFARGGRGGKVVYVDNLNDSGPGSLRAAVTNEVGPRTIVFNVGGVIHLESRLVLSDRYVTIAGQTAPGKGICIRSAPFGIGADDAIVRFIRLRLGAGPTADGMGMNGDHSIMDHCSISWTIDEAFSSRGAKNITLQRTLISEALNSANHKNYPEGNEHGYAATIGGNMGSFHHNLLAHCYGRNWSLGGQLDANNNLAGKLDIRNNVVYNWGSRATDGGAHEVNFVNNYYKPGAGTKRLPEIFTMQHENIGHGTQQCYFTGNVVPGVFDETNQEVGRRAQYSNGATKKYETFVDAPFFEAPVTTQPAAHAYKMVLSDVGANQPFFDAHDTRIVHETLTGTFSLRGSKTNKAGFPDDEADSGGFETYPEVAREENWDSDRDGLPDWWEEMHGLNPNSAPGDFVDANGDPDGDGFTNLEDYLEWMAMPHYRSANGDTVYINVRELARGFGDHASFSVANFINGSGSVTDGVVEFTPAGKGLCSFEFNVSDSAGHDMTRTVNIASWVDQNPEQNHLQVDPAYEEVARGRAAKIVNQMGINDEGKAQRVTDLVADQYIGLNRIHTKRDNALERRPDNADRIKRDAESAVSQLHQTFLDKLAVELDESQIESVKDGITYRVVPLTFENYQLMIPYLTERQKDTMLFLLKEARELAMDGGSSDEKHAWFGKYKGKIANYLSKEGYDLKQLGNDWAERRKKDDTTLAIEASNRIVATLALENSAVKERVRNLIAHQYQRIEGIQVERDSLLAIANASGPENGQVDERVAALETTSKAKFEAQQARYLSKLSEWLSERQIGIVKKGMADMVQQSGS